MKTRFLVALFFVCLVFSPHVFADSRTDFEYQYSKYREHFAEFSLYKKDYLSTSTLDNQQKALLAAKQTLNTRDLTKASFASYVRTLILQNNLNYDPLVSINKGLLEAQQFFLVEAQKGQSVVTMADLDSFDKSYSDTYQKYEVNIKMGIAAQKIAKLKYLSLKQQESLVILKNKISDSASVRVTERVTALESDLGLITEKIDAMANFLISPEGIENTESEIFFTSKIDQLSEIRNLQLNWMDQLIDLDLNYGKI